MNFDKVTFIITSCDRFDLLERTLDSFFKLNKYPIHKFILHEDSGSVDCWYKIRDKYGDKFEILFPNRKQGLSKSIDNLIARVDTEYIFHCEDDWYFEGNPYFISDSLKVLQNKSVHQVWIRHTKDHRHPMTHPIFINGVKVQQLTQWGDWNGFSWNPGLRRLSDIKKMFPNGFSEFGDEIECAKHSAHFGYRAVALHETSVRHIGGGRHTKDFKI